MIAVAGSAVLLWLLANAKPLEAKPTAPRPPLIPGWIRRRLEIDSSSKRITVR